MTEKIKETVFAVTRYPKTAKSTLVGDFKSLAQAEEAMLEHYTNAPKRGKFKYAISEDVLTTSGGVVFRSHTFSLCKEPGAYYKTYEQDQLKAMCVKKTYIINVKQETNLEIAAESKEAALEEAYATYLDWAPETVAAFVVAEKTE